MIKVSALLNRLVPIKVKVVYFPKSNKILFVFELAFVISFVPSQPKIIVMKDVKAFMIIRAIQPVHYSRVDLKRLIMDTI